MTQFKKTNTILIMLLWVLIVSGFPRSAYAYLDPASGSIILQVLVAAVAAMAITIKAFWGRIKMFFSGRPKDSGEPPQ